MYLTLSDAAARLAVHPSTLRRRCDAGAVPGALRVAGPRSAWRIPVSFVDGHDTTPDRGSNHGRGSLAHDHPSPGDAEDYVTLARDGRDTVARARVVARALVVESRPAVALRHALDGIVDVRARHYAGRDGWCTACQWQYPCPDAVILDATVDLVAAAVLDGDR